MNLRSNVIYGISFFAAIIAFQCGAPPDASTPRGAFAKISPCADRRDAKCLFHCLDRDSRWAVETMRKTFEKMQAVVDASYPPAEKARAFGVWKDEAAAPTAEAFFEVYCRRKQCLKWLAEGFGAITAVSADGPDHVTVTTSRKKTFGMRHFDNEWGLDRFHDDLVSAKLRMMDRLAEVELNAKAYEEQKRAGVGEN